MPKDTQNALLIISGLLALNFLLKGRALANMIFTNAQVQGIRFEQATPVITFSVLAQNTNTVGITLRSIAGNVYTTDAGSTVLIGNISNFQGVSIPGNSQVPVMIDCRCNIIGVVNEIISAFQNRNNTKTLKVQAVANIDGIQFPVPEFSMAVGI